MIVISYGLEKSGSTLAFEMAKTVLELDGSPQRRLGDDLVDPEPGVNELGSWSDERLDALVEDTRDERIVVRTHGAATPLTPSKLLGHLAAGDVRVHVTYRDPRDIVLSMLDEGARGRASGRGRSLGVGSVEEAVPILAGRLTNLRSWGSVPCLKLQYERFAFHPRRGPELIGQDLGVVVDPVAVWQLVNRRFTRKNVARRRRHEHEMSDDQRAHVETELADYLALVEGADPGWFEGPPSAS